MRSVIRSCRSDEVVLPNGICPTVLVIDANVECAQSLADLLEYCGYSVLVAIDGRMALALASPPPDIVIVEIALPDVDGYELLEQLRERAGSNRQLVIAVTVRPRDEQVDLQGMLDLHFLKPADPRVLLPALAGFARTLSAK
jgi:DNA-binding response OmpR family regulator